LGFAATSMRHFQGATRDRDDRRWPRRARRHAAAFTVRQRPCPWPSGLSLGDERRSQPPRPRPLPPEV